MKVLGLDFETTSLDTQKARIIEIGAAVFNIFPNAAGLYSWIPEARVSELIWSLGDEGVPHEASEVNGITDKMLMDKGINIIEGFKKLGLLAGTCDMVVCHNEPYDHAMFTRFMDTTDLARFIQGIKHLEELPWICSYRDIKSNTKKKCGTLSHLALDYGVAVNPEGLHRALDDVLLMGEMLSKSGAGPEEMLAYKLAPEVFVAIKVPGPWTDGGKGRDTAKKLGFGWEKAPRTEGPVFEKMWVKCIKEITLTELQDASQYDIIVLQGRKNG